MRTLLALLTSIGACSAIGDIFKEPDIQLDRVIVRGLGITGGNLDLIGLQPGFDVEGQHLGDIA